MPTVKIHKFNGDIEVGDVNENTNLVVAAGIRQFPFPHLRYGCGMGQCTKCKSRILSGSENLPEPNWKEKKLLGSELDEGFRLMCQIWVTHDVELRQEKPKRDDG
ncbi:2Fe-2S iron-sulfur cluster-binding protein [Oceanibium sediminis]|uniref:2Fe-2S iron-sulfur cluster-binding protein n=1 Tax=Oceanibium sediminis TaxID=2026339 RepID=UPI000DD2FBC5|nr:2Fe-2S iron-sulfur cluster-binding protein [Oceanibium sediminis]